MGADTAAKDDAIAIIGMAARFPQSETLEALWGNLARNRICTEPVPVERWEAGGGTAAVPHGGFLRRIDEFDARFFKIAPREAREMDPQQRLFLETVWSALEDAGYGQVRQSPRFRTGLFVGSMWHDYSLLSHEQGYLKNGYAGAGAPTWAVANRVSFALKLGGPSLAVNTACSSSLLAIHLACQSLKHGECEVAVAGGVNLHLHPGKFRYLREETLLATDNEKACFTPDSEGYVPGEGVGAVLLKPLSRALADGDHIEAVIRGSGTNHNGGGMFFKVPNAVAQAELLRTTWRVAGVDPRTISYVEMSAYGSERVDQVELTGLRRAFAADSSGRGRCALGSLKPNLGHLEAACGVAQLIKVVLQLRRKQLLPARFADPLPPDLNLSDGPFTLQRELAPWEPAGVEGDVRRAGISSFGAGGTNVHLVVDEAPARPVGFGSDTPVVIVLSGAGEETLTARASALKSFLDDAPEGEAVRLEDLAWTLQSGREEMRERLAFVAASTTDVREKLARWLADKDAAPDVHRGKARPETFAAVTGGTLEEVAARWARGEAIEWFRASAQAPRRISLPTYPFQRESYWLGHDLPATEAAPHDDGRAATLGEAARDYLRAVIGDDLGLPAARVESDLTFEELGFDSLVINRLNLRLEQDLGPVSKTLFFRYRTAAELADYLVQAVPQALESLRARKAKVPAQPIGGAGEVAAVKERRLYEPAAPMTADDDIAIIGLAGRFPGADSVDAFWENLRQGRDCITEVPAERWESRRWYQPIGDKVEKSYSKWGGFLEGVDRFDPLFFDISPREAALMDPQERLFLETAWHAMEDAGYTAAELAARREGVRANVGVFVGVMWSEYQFFGVEEALRGRWVSPSSAFWSVPNRVSFCFNFDGPSLALDTACSSSLVALHLACESLRRGDCATALAGGVSLSLHPMKYVGLSQKRFASTDGRCRSFGAGGDGYVPGEGVGAVLLKPLRRAIADRDAIHGVIKGTHVNHGGRTNGYTVPNPHAQGALIAAALRKAGLDPRTIGYVEAHGTGTALGDPIEVDGLTEAFRAFTADRQFCALGSVKSNIGHLESAAGIAGLTKVLLQFRHQAIAPSLHSAQLNPNIDFASTPFHVPQSLMSWSPPAAAAGEGGPAPRRAGISSFGAGGVNAHVIVEEWRPAPAEARAPEVSGGRRLFVFSAREVGRLRELASQFAAFAERSRFNLADAAYTLHVGRTHFEERLAVIAGDTKDLVEKLRGWLGDGVPPSVFVGTNRQGRPARVAGADAHVAALRPEAELSEIALAWVAGSDVDWARLYDGEVRQRIHLPTYRFARERHWVTTSAEDATPGPALHPMIDANCSSFASIAFRKSFSGEERVVRDHVVSGKHIIPGVAWLEMVLAAAELASGSPAVAIEDFVWLRPVACEGEPCEVSVRMQPAGDGRAACELLLARAGRNEVIGRGTAVCSTESVSPARPRPEPDEVRARCEERRDGQACYRELNRLGLAYGPALRGVRELFLDGVVGLARLAVEPDETTDPRIKLPVALLDGAFQAAALQATRGLPEDRAVTLLPFRLGALHVHGPAPRQAWAVVERRIQESNAADGVFVYDLFLTDETGAAWADVHGFTLKAMSSRQAAIAPRLHLYRPAWKAMPAPLRAGREARLLSRVLVFSQRDLEALPSNWDVFQVSAGATFTAEAGRAVLDPTNADHFTKLWESLLVRGWHPEAIVHLWDFGQPEAAAGNPQQRRLESGLMALFHLMRTGFVAGWPEREVRWLHLYPVNGDAMTEPLSAAVAGFARSVALEQPWCRGRVVAVGLALSEDARALWSAVESELDGSDPADVEIRIGDQGRVARRLAAWEPTIRDLPPDALRRDGAWIVTGGAGGLGQIFAEELVRLGAAAIVLVGRRHSDARLEPRLAKLRAGGARVEYVSADISDEGQVRALTGGVRARHGCIRGVIHSAGVLRDAFLRKKTPEAFATVLAPKIWGTRCLDEATRGDDLDAFVLFSSTAALTGNAGQTDYAAGNRFMDEFAAWRNRAAARGERRGRAVSINWPLWREGGMQVNEAAEEALRERLGMTPLSTAHGLAAFRAALAHDVEQVAVVEGEPAGVASAFGSSAGGTEASIVNGPVSPLAGAGASAEPAGSTADDGDANLGRVRSAIERHLRSLVADESGVAPDRLEADAPLERYGLDSVMVMNLNRRLEKDLPGLSKTLFYEYQTLTTLTEYLLKTRREQMRARFVPASPAMPEAIPPAPPAKAMPAATETTLSVRGVPVIEGGGDAPEARDAGGKEVLSAAGDIAIIGVSGRYPQAHDWTDLWDVLASGRDCISEIPRDRWDYRRYYDPAKGKPGRTYGKWGGFIAGYDAFDPLFFNISPREAEMMDPQERLFLQAAWHAIEDAGYRKSELEQEPVGVFAGAMWAHYQMVGLNECLAGAGAAPTALHASIANRVSYCLNFRGPSIALDTMCSSSLTALHLACESLRRGECAVALAGGVNICTHPVKYQLLAQNGMLSTDGRCRSFGARGDGYVPGEGVGLLLLKPLRRALRDGDHVHGVIKGSLVNHGGKTNGYTVPNPLAQAEVIRMALQRAGVDPASISYIEAHGTGTTLGDPIEMNGLERAFAGTWTRAGACAVGSIKSNIGHLESAAGVAAISKVLLQFRHGSIAPSLHAAELNPNIDFTRSPFRVVHGLETWSRPAKASDGASWPRRAGVSSFGAGGANAHVVLEEAPEIPGPGAETTELQLIVLSAKNPERLKAAAARFAAWFEENARAERRPSLADVAWTLQIGREEMDTRAAFLAKDYAEAAAIAGRLARGDRHNANLKQGERSELTQAVRTLLDGAAGQAFVAQLVALRDWSRLAELWVAGIAVDWRLLHPAPRRRVPLPGYRFSTQRFWVPNPASDEVVATVDSAPEETATAAAAGGEARLRGHVAAGGQPQSHAPAQDLPEDLFLVRDWRPVARTGLEREEAGFRGILLVNTECPARVIEEARPHWLVVQAGPDLHFDPSGISTMDFDNPEHGRVMMARIWSSRPRMNAVIDLGDVWSEPRDQWAVEMGRVTLLQSCLAAPSRGSLHWLHLTNGLHTFAHPRPSMAGAAMSGLIKMLSAECPRVRAQTADLECAPAAFGEIRAIFAGMRSGAADEVEVCYRGGVRYVPGVRRLELADSAQPPLIREDRAYVITGGTSGLGLEIARHLVAKGARRLALMGIHPLPPRAEWAAKLAGAEARARRRLESFLEFERTGVRIETYFGPLDDVDAVPAYLARVAERLGPIAGVIHSATATFNQPDPYLLTKSPEEIQGVLTPKLAGTRQLASILERGTLDFFVLFSSVASALPSRGQGVSHYAMANAFLDRFAEQQAARGRSEVKCINWVYWGEAGGVAGAEHRQKLARYGIFPQSNREGLASFDRVLAMQAPRALVGRLGETLRAEARLDPAVWRETRAATAPAAPASLERNSLYHADAIARLRRERASQAELRDYAALALLRAMRSRHVLIAGGRRYRVSELGSQLAVAARQNRLWRALMGLLGRHGFLSFTDAENFLTTGRLEADEITNALSRLPRRAERFAAEHPGFASYIRLIDTAMASLWDVLRGERAATDVLFPGGSVDLVEAVYQGNPVSDHFNDLLAQTAADWLAGLHGTERRLRVLEVGAGTGGTSCRMLDALRPLSAKLEYVYT
ncbi:MAG TPA: SDR family NAD(P)-dependent oxidoreductase, partial [Opitutaceae bacterium]